MKPHPESLDGKPPPKRYRWWRFVEHSLPIIIIYLMVATLVGFLIAPNVIVTVPTGHVGILWKRFRGGTQLDPRLLEGRGHAGPAAVGQAVPLRPAAADHDRHLQRHFQGRRESQRDDQHPVPAEARRGAATPPDHRPGLHHADADARKSATGRARSSPHTRPKRSIRPSARRFRRKSARTPRRCSARACCSGRNRRANTASTIEISLDEMLILYDTLVLGLELPATVNAAINRKIEQYYLVQEYALPRRARREGIRAQADRGERHPRLPADGDAGNFRFLRALARHRSDAATRAVAQHQDRDHRQRQGRPAGHPRQRRHADAAESGDDAGRRARPRQQRSGQATAGRREPAAPGKDSGQQPAEPGRTAVADRGAARASDTPPAPPGGPPPNSPPGAPPGKQSEGPPAEPRTSWTWSELQDLISRTVRSGDRPARRRPPSPMAGPVPASGGRRAASSSRQGLPPSRQAEGPPRPPAPDRGTAAAAVAH